MEIQKWEYLENEKSFLDEMKNISHSFFKKLSFGEKQKFDKKQQMQTLNTQNKLVKMQRTQPLRNLRCYAY